MTASPKNGAYKKMSKSVINCSQNAPYYTNFLEIFWGSMPQDPFSLASRLQHSPTWLDSAISLILFQNLTCLLTQIW